MGDFSLPYNGNCSQWKTFVAFANELDFMILGQNTKVSLQKLSNSTKLSAYRMWTGNKSLTADIGYYAYAYIVSLAHQNYPLYALPS